VFAASLVCFAVPAVAYDEFHPLTSGKKRYEWAIQEAYPYYCPGSVSLRAEAPRFEKLNPIAKWGLGFASKQDIADFIQKECGNESALAAHYVGN